MGGGMGAGAVPLSKIFESSNTMTAAEAAALANALHPQIAVPTHYGSIVGTMTDGDDFAAQLAPGIRCVKLI